MTNDEMEALAMEIADDFKGGREYWPLVSDISRALKRVAAESFNAGVVVGVAGCLCRGGENVETIVNLLKKPVPR